MHVHLLLRLCLKWPIFHWNYFALLPPGTIPGSVIGNTCTAMCGRLSILVHVHVLGMQTAAWVHVPGRDLPDGRLLPGSGMLDRVKLVQLLKQ